MVVAGREGVVTPDVVRLGASTSGYVQRGGWFVNNAGWITGPQTTVLIDTCATEARTQALLTAARAGDEDRPLILAVTHAHGDHANGAGLVARRGGRVLACGPAAADIAAGPHTYPDVFAYTDWGDIAPPPVIEPVTEAVTIDTGAVEVHLLPVPITAHTSGDLVAWVPAERVLFTGDLVFHGMTPLALSGSVRGWLDALAWLTRLPASIIVPGHGPVARLDDDDPLGMMTEYLSWVLNATSDTTHPDFEALAHAARSRWPHWPEAERHTVNLRVAHAETHDYPLDFAAAVGAMARAAGGAPIRLHL